MSLGRSIGCMLTALTVTTAASALDQDHQHPATAEKLGTVHLDTSCRAAAQPAFDRALALLHSFEFGAAVQGFKTTLAADPECAMAYWGIALSQWANPFSASLRPPAQLQSGLDAVQQAERAAAKTARERAYIAAASKLFVDFDKIDQRARAVAYEKAMADLAAAYPEDREASVFHALSLAASALPADKTYANQIKAGAILEKIYAEQPDHPGVAHYIIHAYDYPPLADRALDAARRYSEIAPSAPHALHMPSHTFTRVGNWEASIASNTASAAAARRAGSAAEELHATDYLTYAYLQTGQDAAVRKLLESLTELETRLRASAGGGAAPPLAGPFALAAVRARWAIERRDWAAAAALEPRATDFPYTEAMTHFARALGAAHTQALADARRSIAALEQIHDRLTQAKESYWAEQVDLQRQGASAFLAMAEGKSAEALQLMRAAADREDATEKNVVTPGAIAPARELLGDMLLAMNQPGQAIKEFQSTLQREPNRFRAIYGAAKAASLAGDRATAVRFYTQLLKQCERGDTPGRPELVEARRAANVPR